MFPKGTVPDKQLKKETMVYIVGEKDVQVALKRAGRTEVKKAVICACTVVVTTLILVAGTLGAITLWLSFHHPTHNDHFSLSNGNHGYGAISPTSGGQVNDDDRHTSFVDKGYADVTEAFTDVPGVATDIGDILIDEGDRSSTQSGTKTPNPTHKPTTEITPSAVDESKSSWWESYSAPLHSSVFMKSNPSDSFDDSFNQNSDGSSFDLEVISGSGLIPDEESEDYVEIPYRVSGESDYSNFEFIYDPGTYSTGNDPDWNYSSGSGSGDAEDSGDYFIADFDDTLQVNREEPRPKLRTPQEFIVVRYPIPVSKYGTLCTSNSCTIGFMMENDDRVEVIETDLQIRPRKLTVLHKGGSKLFTIIRDENQGYRAILLEESRVCLLARLEDIQNLKIRRNSAKPIVEKLRITLSVELPDQLLGQIGGPIMTACRDVPVFWAQQQIGDGDDLSIINRLGRSLPPSRGDNQEDLIIERGVHFQCCWCADLDDPCPCECGRF